MSTGRTIAIGDIHGCLVALDTLLTAIAPTSQDTLVILGDVIDRGPSTRQCIDRLLELRKACRVVHLMGNHEEMFLDVLSGGSWSQSWYQFGGQEMLASYGGGLEAVPPEHLHFIRSGKDYFETGSQLFVHGFVRPLIPIEQESTQWLRWARFQVTEQRHCSGQRVLCGHTAQPSGYPLGTAGYVCLDTCVYCDGGALSALDVEADQLWQATQAGELRPARPLQDVLRSEPDL
jgi:serine/threonine protein phosphatase 1